MSDPIEVNRVNQHSHTYYCAHCMQITVHLEVGPMELNEGYKKEDAITWSCQTCGEWRVYRIYNIGTELGMIGNLLYNFAHLTAGQQHQILRACEQPDKHEELNEAMDNNTRDVMDLIADHVTGPEGGEKEGPVSL